MNSVQDLLAKTLKDNGFSLTNPRKITFNALVGPQPLTMQEIVRRTKHLIDRATVYRTIDVFEKAKITQRVYSGWKYKIELSDTFQEHHHHFTCINCGKIITIQDEDVEGLIQRLSKTNNFQIVSHQLEIQGLCSQCS